MAFQRSSFHYQADITESLNLLYCKINMRYFSSLESMSIVCTLLLPAITDQDWPHDCAISHRTGPSSSPTALITEFSFIYLLAQLMRLLKKKTHSDVLFLALLSTLYIFRTVPIKVHKRIEIIQKGNILMKTI